MEDTRRLLPVVEFDNKEFLVDIDNREFKDINDMDSAVNMHSRKGRKMVELMQGTEWRRFAIEPGMKGIEV
jgi:hypothetical protein